MKTRLSAFFNEHIINEAGMMTRSQKKAFDKQYGASARFVQERRKIFEKLSAVKNTVKTAIVPFHEPPRYQPSIFDEWISPSQMKHYFRDDPFMYVLFSASKMMDTENGNNVDIRHTGNTRQNVENVNNVRNGVENREIGVENEGKPRNKELTFQNKLAEDGIYFESQVYDYYRKQFGADMLFIETEAHDTMVTNRLKREQTKQAILSGVPIICQGVLWNDELKIFGIADMIVRSDYIPKLVEEFKLSENDEGLHVKAPNLNGTYHYRVVDIKSKTVDILKDGFTMSNNEKHRYFKAQLWCYNSEVSRIQGYDSRTAYILGKRTECLNVKTDVFNHTFGVVDFIKDIHVRNNVMSCLQWITNAKKWAKLLVEKDVEYFSFWVSQHKQLPCVELYPNMKRDSDMRKTAFAHAIKEISCLYYCGKAQRNKAFASNIYTYDDPKINAAMLGFKEGNRQKCVDVDILLSRTNQPIYPPKGAKLKTSFFGVRGNTINITTAGNGVNAVGNTGNGVNTSGNTIVAGNRNTTEKRDYFAVVDFEFLTEPNFDNLPNISQVKINFMIGFFMKNYSTNEIVERTFMVKRLDVESEKEMVLEFINFLSTVYLTLGDNGGVRNNSGGNTNERNHNGGGVRNNSGNDHKKLVLHHWGNADQTQWNHLQEKYAPLMERVDGIHSDFSVELCDMSDICRSEPIMVCGAHGFSLKPYVKQMIERKIITSTAWNDTCCLNGNDAVCYVTKANKECKEGQTPLCDHPLMKQVIPYNKADCRVVWELYEGLKLYYSS